MSAHSIPRLRGTTPVEECVLRGKTITVRVARVGPERIYTIPAEGGVRGTILFVHGLTDHPGRHFATARDLSRQGFTTFMFDLAGHGGRGAPFERTRAVYRAYADEDDGPLHPSDLSAAAASGSEALAGARYAALRDTRFEHHMRQLRTVFDHIAGSASDGAPFFLMGFSMGGLIAAEAVLRRMPAAHGLSLAGTIFISPAFKPKGRPGNSVENRLIDSLWSMRGGVLAPFRTAVKSVLDLNFELDCTWGAPWMSDLIREVELYRTDPLVLAAIPSAYASSIEEQMARTEAAADEFPADALFLFPSEDGITSLAGGERFARRVRTYRGDAGCTTIGFPVAAHDLRRSSVRRRVLETVNDWLEPRVPAARAA